MRNPAEQHAELPLSVEICRNCATPLAGEFCYNCGQEHTAAILPLRDVVEDVVGEYMTFDSKIFRSIRPLLLKPGFLTTEYIAGRRAFYLLPSRLYLVIAVIFFFFTGKYDPITIEQNYDNAEAEIAAIMSAKGISHEEVVQRFDAAVSSILATAILATIPVFTIFFKILFPKRLITEHLVFSFHFFSFMLICLMPGLFYEPLNFGLLFVIAVYLTIAIRKTYGTSWLRTMFSGIAAFIFWVLLLNFVFQVILRFYGFSSV